MRRVIQRTITTTKIISLTITHSESEEEVEYTLAASADQLPASEPMLPDEAATATSIEPESADPEAEAPNTPMDTSAAHAA